MLIRLYVLPDDAGPEWGPVPEGSRPGPGSLWAAGAKPGLGCGREAGAGSQEGRPILVRVFVHRALVIDKGLEHLQIFYPWWGRVLEHSMETEGRLGEVTYGFLTVARGGVAVALITTLFKGQLYCIPVATPTQHASMYMSNTSDHTQKRYRENLLKR